MAEILELPGSGVVVSDQLIKENPMLIKKFLRGTLRGFQYVHDPKNRDEIINWISKDFRLEPDIAAINYQFILDGVGVGVHQGERVVVGLGADHAQHRAEDLVGVDGHVRGDWSSSVVPRKKPSEGTSALRPSTTTAAPDAAPCSM